MYSIKNIQSFEKDLTEKGFPWANLTINPDEHIQRFLNYKPKVENSRYKLSAFRPKCRYYLPPLFHDENVTIGSLKKDISEINNLTDFWTEKVRLSTRKLDESQSPLELIESKETKKGVLATLQNENPDIDQCTEFQVRQVFGFVIHEARNFKLTWAKGLLSFVGGLDFWKGKRWLDISTGYGDRLLAAALLEFGYYLGFDPNSTLIEPLNDMIQYLEKRNPKLEGKLKSVTLPFEDSEIILTKEEPFDLVFSSPPFFNGEIYSDEKTQSVKRFTSFDGWMKNFFFKSIEIAWKHLKEGGYLILYVGDPQTVKGSIAEPMNLFIESLDNSNYEGVIGVENHLGIFRPCWVWSKAKSDCKVRRKLWKPYVKRSLKSNYPELVY